MTIRIQVYGQHAAAAQSILRGAAALGFHGVTGCAIAPIYFLADNPGEDAIQRLSTYLLVDPVTETADWTDLSIEDPPPPLAGIYVVEVAPRPGVTDVTARELARGMEEIGLPACEVTTATRYELSGDLAADELRTLAGQLLCNETIQHFSIGPMTPHFGAETTASNVVESVELAGLSAEDLLTLSRERLLSLDLEEMRTIQDFYFELGRPPTDIELETLAQTWSEHCVHKTFRAAIEFTWEDADGNVLKQEMVDGLLNQYIRAATDAVYPDWLHSAFVDDAGIFAFDETHDLAFKVETHNHPSALEPFGGANTGIGGVVRDIIGVSARPIATTDALCFGPQETPLNELPDGMLHPQRIAEGVVAGIGDYGNKLGLPTVNGAVIYDKGYLGNPLVFCGCAGLLPRGSHPTSAQVGDAVVALGGRTGRDGLHGATFSSVELTHETSETSGSAVQIGDPITEKGLIELIEAARDEQLYNAITDCGAGGFSSSVGEMGEELGVDIELTNVPLKYPGLTPWEIWLSEAQERMVIAVPPAKLERLHALAALWDVEVSVLGTFTGEHDLVVRYDGRVVAHLPMSFVHDGLPRRRMKAVWRDPLTGSARAEQAAGDEVSVVHVGDSSLDLNQLLLTLLADPTVASKESIVRTYDHEVRGGTLVRPFTGPEMDGPSDAAVLKPLGTWTHDKAFSLSNGLNPRLGKRDPYAMAISAIDEAVRNAVAVGTDPDRIAILDNFCWGNPTLPDRLGALVRCCQGCYDGAVAYRTPFISGKDSLYNEFNGQPIPGTLLVSAIGIVPEMEACVTSDLKQAGNILYLLGETKAELGGSLLYEQLDRTDGTAPTMPEAPLARYRALHQAMLAGTVKACHDLSEGGLAISLAEMCLAGRLGASITVPESKLAAIEYLFSESNGRLLVEVAPADVAAFEDALKSQTVNRIGQVTHDATLSINVNGAGVINVSVEQLVAAWKREVIP